MCCVGHKNIHAKYKNYTKTWWVMFLIYYPHRSLYCVMCIEYYTEAYSLSGRIDILYGSIIADIQKHIDTGIYDTDEKNS